MHVAGDLAKMRYAASKSISSSIIVLVTCQSWGTLVAVVSRNEKQVNVVWMVTGGAAKCMQWVCL